MREGYVPIRDVVEEMDFFFLQGQGGPNRVNGRITPTFVEEPSVLIKLVEEVEIGIGSQPVKVADLEIGPLYQVS